MPFLLRVCPITDSINMVEEPWGQFDPSSTARMCLRVHNWVKRGLEVFSGLILMISGGSRDLIEADF